MGAGPVNAAAAHHCGLLFLQRRTLPADLRPEETALY